MNLNLSPPGSLHWHPHTPLGHKRQRLSLAGQFAVSTPANFSIPLPSLLSFDATLPESSLPGHGLLSFTENTLVAPTAALISHQDSLTSIEALAQAARLRVVDQEQGDKQTAATYQRHVRSYQTWWENSSGFTTISAFPITASKVTLFLEHETTREKVKSSYQIKLLLSDCSLVAQTWQQGKHHWHQCWQVPNPTSYICPRASSNQQSA